MLSRRALLGGALGGLLVEGSLPVAAVRAQDTSGLRGSLDATYEGLIPGAADDQGFVLTRALAAAEERGYPLFLPAGRYEVSQVDLPSHAHLIGVPGRTELVFRGGPFMLRSRGAQFLRIEGITLDGASLPLGEGGGLLDAESVADAVIHDCAFTDSSADAITLRDCGGRVENSRVSAAREAGIHLIQSRGMIVGDNVVVDCGDTGILVARHEEGPDNSIVRNNSITATRADSGGTGQNGNGINLDRVNGVIIAGNRVDGSAFSAIRCFSSDNVAVTSNVTTRSGEVGIFVEFAFEGAIVADNVIDGAVGGISFANFMEHGGRLGICSGNIVRNIVSGPRYADGVPQIGIGIAAEADMAISHNVIENAVWGMQLGWGPYLRDINASGNTIRQTRIGIAVSVVEGAGSAIIADNLIAGAVEGAIVGMRWEERATDDLLLAGADAFPHLTITGNRAG